MLTNIGHSLPDLDENGDLIKSSTNLNGACTPPQRTSMDDHVRHFSDRYANFLQNRDSESDSLLQQQRRDLRQEIDYAVSRALEKLSISSTPNKYLGQGFGTPGADAPADSGKTDKEAVLADMLAAAEKLMGCAISPSSTAKISVKSSPVAPTTQPLPQQNPVVSTPFQLQMARPTATLAPNDSEHELLDTFLARFDNFVTYFKWSEDDKLFYLRNNLGSIGDSILCDCSTYTKASEFIILLQNRFGTNNQKESFRIELNARRRGPKETLQSLYLDIKRLLRQAYKNASQETLDSIGIEKFVNAFGNRELRRSVLQHNCPTLADALNVAIHMEAIDMATGPLDNVPTYDSVGIRRNMANVRLVSVDDPYYSNTPDFNAVRSDLTF